MSMKIYHFQFSEHAKVRANQRGVSKPQLKLVINYADIFVSVGRDLSAGRLSRQAVNDAVADGVPPSEVDRLKRLAIVEAADGKIVTIAVVHGKKGKHYRRRMRRFWKDYGR